ncbi:MAG: GntR family transcriptional regulator [Enterocloster sp.]
MSNTSFNQKGVSLYYQVETYIRTKIESGEWPSGFKLPTETELCQYFGVSRTTIRQAVNKMVEGGLLMRKQGSGTYVTQPAYSRNRLSTQPSDSVCNIFICPFFRMTWSIPTRTFC